MGPDLTDADPDDGGANDWPLELDLEIRTFEIDFAGHVSNIVYIQWLEIARTSLLDAVGLPIPQLVDEGTDRGPDRDRVPPAAPTGRPGSGLSRHHEDAMELEVRSQGRCRAPARTLRVDRDGKAQAAGVKCVLHWWA